MQTKELIKALRIAAKNEPMLLTMPPKETEKAKLFSQAADALEATLWREPSKSESGNTYIARVGDVTITATRVGTHWMTRGQEIFPSAIMDLPAPPEAE